MYMTEKELKDIVAYQAKQIMHLESVTEYLRNENEKLKEQINETSEKSDS